MVLLAELVCEGCHQILTYPLGSMSCRCRSCRTINPAQHIQVECGKCSATVLFPINTLSGLCPCCCTVTQIPVEMLPELPEIAFSNGGDAGPTKTIYVENPNTVIDGRSYPSICVATKIA